MKRRDNNRGFTLVEFIIAVAILAVAVSPLIANFIQSSKMNYKGRQDLDAMNLAQDIMEGLSGYTVDEVNECINKVIVNESGTESLKGNILPLTSEYSAVTKTSADGVPVVEYKISNVETIGDINNVYNVEVVLDPTGADQEKFNDKEVAEIAEINQYYDAIFTIPTAADMSEAINHFKDISTTGVADELYYGRLKRLTTISIQNGGTEAAPNYKVSVSRSYSAASGEIGVLGISNFDKKVITTDNISRMDSDKFPRSVYIYFKGIDGATYTGTERKESFVVENTTGQPITVYLIRTQSTDSNGNALTEDETYGTNFGCEVAVISKDMDGNYTEDVHVVSNLRYNLNAPSPRYNFRITTEDGEPIYDMEGNPRVVDGKKLGPELPKKDDGTRLNPSDTTYINARALYFYNTASVTEDVYQKCFSDGYKRKDKNTIYKVTINLYDTKTGSKVATYDGGLAN